MRLELELILLYVVEIAEFSYFFLYRPELWDFLVYYTILSTACIVAVMALTFRRPVDADNTSVMTAAVTSHVSMMIVALAVGGLVARRTDAMLFAALSPPEAVALILFIGIGEVLFYVAVPLAIAAAYPRYRYVAPPAFAAVFALLHYRAYGCPAALIQPLVAALINQYIAIRYRNVTGIVLGHFLTDVAIMLA